jgi:hypothetical protein
VVAEVNLYSLYVAIADLLCWLSERSAGVGVV